MINCPVMKAPNCVTHSKADKSYEYLVTYRLVRVQESTDCYDSMLSLSERDGGRGGGGSIVAHDN